MQATEKNSTKMITPAQIRMIYGIGRRNGLDDDMIHHVAQNLFGKDSLRDLTCWQAGQVIDSLRRKTGEAMEPIQERASEAQRKYILGLAERLMMKDTRQLRHFLRARFGVDDMSFLTPENASKVIEGLKAMISRLEKNTRTENKI